MLNIKFKNLAILSYGYIVLPIIIFFITWLKWYIGIPMAIVLCIGLIALIKRDYIHNKENIELPIKTCISIGIVLFVWVWLSGQGGFFFQTWDNHSRNAIFRDLIDFNWPVIYPETGNGLVYYFIHWLVPALFGKIFGWTAANIVLFIWSYIGIIISFLLISHIIKVKEKNKLWILCIIMITWSGLNILGMVITDILDLSVHQVGLNSAE